LLGCDGEGVEGFGSGFGARLFEVFGVGLAFVAAAVVVAGPSRGEEGAAVGLSAWHFFVGEGISLSNLWEKQSSARLSRCWVRWIWDTIDGVSAKHTDRVIESKNSLFLPEN
jgi:hypothetical protein